MIQSPFKKLAIVLWLCFASYPLKLIYDKEIFAALPLGIIFLLGLFLLLKALRKSSLVSFDSNLLLIIFSWFVLASIFFICMDEELIIILIYATPTLAFLAFAFSESQAQALKKLWGPTLLTYTLIFLGIFLEATFRFVPAFDEARNQQIERWRWNYENYYYDRVGTYLNSNPRFMRTKYGQNFEEKNFRILTLGDSFTWGAKVSKIENIWPYVLETKLRGINPNTEVHNYAAGGFTTVNELEVLEKWGWKVKPNLIVLQFFLNDPLPSRPGLYHKGELWYYNIIPLLPGVHSFLEGKSLLYEFLNTKFSIFQMKFKEANYDGLYRNDFIGWIETKKAIKEISNQAKKHNVPILFVLFPSFAEGSLDKDSYRYIGIHNKIMNDAISSGMDAIDLRETFAKINPDGRYWWALDWDSHPNIKAHEIAGIEIANLLLDSQLL